MQPVAASDDITAAEYDRYRTSAPPDLYARLREFGVAASARVLDIGIGTGLAAAPLAAEGATIAGADPSAAMVAKARARFPNAEIVQASAEQLPFADASFDAAIAADVFHLVDQEAALGEARRVVRKGGAVALWWATLAGDNAVLGLRGAAAREAGTAAVPEALGGGFRSFYAAPFADRALRVVPWQHDTTVAGWIGYERTRAEVHRALGARAGAWLQALEQAMIQSYGSPDAAVRVRLLYYLYVGIV